MIGGEEDAPEEGETRRCSRLNLLNGPTFAEEKYFGFEILNEENETSGSC